MEAVQWLGDRFAILGTDGLRAEEVGDGNLNLVFVVRGAVGGAVIVKQALPYLRVAGADWPLSRERMRFEIAALVLHNQIAPERVPTVLHVDEEMSLVAMEFLENHEVMRAPLLAGRRFPRFHGWHKRQEIASPLGQLREQRRLEHVEGWRAQHDAGRRRVLGAGRPVDEARRAPDRSLERRRSGSRRHRRHRCRRPPA